MINRLPYIQYKMCVKMLNELGIDNVEAKEIIRVETLYSTKSTYPKSRNKKSTEISRDDQIIERFYIYFSSVIESYYEKMNLDYQLNKLN